MDFGDAAVTAGETGDTSQTLEELPKPAVTSAGLFDTGAGFSETSSALLPNQGGGNDPVLYSTTSTQSLEVDFSEAFPAQDMVLGADFSDAFPSLHQSMSSDPFSVDADQAFTLAEPDLNDASLKGNDSFSEPQPVTSASRSSLFGLDFGGLTSVSAPTMTSKPVESVKSTDQQPPTTHDSPVLATFYLGGSSMSTHSSAAELTAIADLGGTSMEAVDPMDKKSDPFADLFNSETSSGVVSPLGPLSCLADSATGNSPPCLLKGADGSLEPAELPPPPPPTSTSPGGGGEGQMMSDVAPVATLFTGSECEQGEATAESDEVHFCQSCIAVISWELYNAMYDLQHVIVHVWVGVVQCYI